MISFQFLPPKKHRIQSLDHFPVLRLMFLSFEYSGMHTTRVFWSEAYSKISLSVKSKFFSCKHSIHDFIFEKTDHLGPKVLYYGRQHLKKCLHSDHWLHSVKSPPSKNALFELAHAKKSFLNQDPIPLFFPPLVLLPPFLLFLATFFYHLNNVYKSKKST